MEVLDQLPNNALREKSVAFGLEILADFDLGKAFV